MLPAAFALRILAAPRDTWERRAAGALGYLVLAGVVSLLVFRLLQPYAFSGPGFLGVKLNPQWVANIQEQRNQATGDVDFPCLAVGPPAGVVRLAEPDRLGPGPAPGAAGLGGLFVGWMAHAPG